MDYFSFFNLPRKLALDVVALEKQFYALSRKLHPDRFASKPVAEQEAALAESSLLNDAYRTLKDPVARTQYLLTLEGVELEEQSKAATDAARASGEQKKQIVPPELLEEVFELNMQLQEMRAAKQMGEDEQAEKVKWTRHFFLAAVMIGDCGAECQGAGSFWLPALSSWLLGLSL